MRNPRPGDTIFIIGAGPIVIGQACEFDYSGCQACKVLKEKGFRTVLLNSNPATIMTDPDMADAVYIEPMTPESCLSIIEKEKPNFLLPTMGGQTALNLTRALHKQGGLKTLQVLGATIDAIETAENREAFKKLVERLGYNCLRSVYVKHLDDALKALTHLSFPLILRSSFTLGGQGGIVVHTPEAYLLEIKNALDLSPVGEALVEQSCVGWKEIELEVMKDGHGNSLVVCGIENLDPMGVHTGDSITVAPLQTVSDGEYQIMRSQALDIMDGLGIQTGGANIQFCQDPKTKSFYVIEVNPRVSRSSALASKATGFPIAKIAALVAIGESLDAIQNDITRETPASFEPALDYVVVKLPKFNFEKFPSESSELGISMKAIGETMAVGRTFEESLMKGLRSLTQSNDPIQLFEEKYKMTAKNLDEEALRGMLGKPSADRLLYVWFAFEKGFTVDAVHNLTHISPWFLEKIQHLSSLRKSLKEDPTNNDRHTAHHHGFHQFDPDEGLTPYTFSTIDTCAAEFVSYTPYGYASASASKDELPKGDVPWVAIIGSGPNQIGQGLEFDSMCVHAIQGVKSKGFRTLMINNNPETVSTDYDCSDALVFEPIAPKDIVHTLKSFTPLKGVVLMMGGQSAINVAKAIQEADIPILGASQDRIDLCEDRDRFRQFLSECRLKSPEGCTLNTLDDLKQVADTLNFPMIVRPSFIIGGSDIHILANPKELQNFAQQLETQRTAPFPMVAEHFLSHALEYDCDVICDHEGNIVIAGIIEHVEQAGIHSGDSTGIFPPYYTDPSLIERIEQAAYTITRTLQVNGLLNIQFAIQDDELYVIEVNPRGSRTVPFLSKSTGLPIARIATQVALGETLADHFPLMDGIYSLNKAYIPFYSVKKPVFPFDRFKGADVILGPQMKSTGEAMGISRNFYTAYKKALIASGQSIPAPGSTFFITLCDEDKHLLAKMIRPLIEKGYHLVTTEGTHAALQKLGISSQKVYKNAEGHPNALDLVAQGRVHFIFNTTRSKRAMLDEIHIRRLAVRYRVPYCTDISEMQVISKLIQSWDFKEKVSNIRLYHDQVRLGGF